MAKRYNVVLPDDLWQELARIAEENHTTVIDVIRRSLKLAFIAWKLQGQDDSALIFREKGIDREIILI